MLCGVGAVCRRIRNLQSATALQPHPPTEHFILRCFVCVSCFRVGAGACFVLPRRDMATPVFSPQYSTCGVSSEKARRDFALHSTPLGEWVKTTVDWYGEHHDGANSFGYESRDDEVSFARRWREEYGRLVDPSR